MKSTHFLSGLILMIFVFVSLAQAGVLAVNEIVDHYTKETQTQKFYMQKDKLRLETVGENIIIFRADKDLIWTININENSYTEMSKADIKEMSAKMDGVMAQQKKIMEEQMKSLPAEQQEMMKQMMNETFAEEAETTYTKKASGEKVDSWKCDKYEGYQEDVKVEEVWTTDEKKLGIGTQEFETLKEMSEMFSDLNKENDQIYAFGSKEAEKEQQFSGVPVKTVVYEDGEPIETTQLKEVKSENFKASLFELPEGFTKIDWRNQMEGLDGQQSRGKK